MVESNNELFLTVIILVIAIRMGWRWYKLYSISRNKHHPEHEEHSSLWPDFNGPIIISFLICAGLCFQFNFWYFLDFDYFALPSGLNVFVLITTNLITILVLAQLANEAQDISKWLYELLRGGWAGKQIRGLLKNKNNKKEEK